MWQMVFTVITSLLASTDDFHSAFVKIERENGHNQSGSTRAKQPLSCRCRKRASMQHLQRSSLVIFFPPPTHFSSISSELFRVVDRNIVVFDTFHHFSCHQSIFGISWILLLVVCNLSISIGINMKSSRGSVERDGVPLKEYPRYSSWFSCVLCSDTLEVPMMNRWHLLHAISAKRCLAFLRLCCLCR